jgi:hypothetical protein
VGRGRSPRLSNRIRIHWSGFHPVLFRCLKGEEWEKEKAKKEKPIIKTNINPKVC